MILETEYIIRTQSGIANMTLSLILHSMMILLGKNVIERQVNLVNGVTNEPFSFNLQNLMRVQAGIVFSINTQRKTRKKILFWCATMFAMV